MRKKKNKNRSRKTNKGLGYQDLEQRQLLATLGFDAGSGQLDVNLDTAGETAVVSINGAGQVTVNGSNDLNSTAAGVQASVASAINTLNVNGTPLTANLSVALDGNFTGANSIQTLSVTDVSQLTIVGQYEIDGDATVVLQGVGSTLGDGPTSSLSVDGVTSITARNNDVLLTDNVDLNVLNVSTLGGADVTIADSNSLVLNNVNASGDLNLTAPGSITDVTGSSIDVNGDGIFEASSVVLGDQAGDTVNFRRTGFDVSGLVELHEDSNIVFVSSNIGSLVADSPGGIFDGRATNINIAGNASLTGNAAIRLGEHGTDTFNAGSLTFQTSGHAHFFEDSGTLLVGDSNARTLNVTSLGDVTDNATATLTTLFSTGLQGDNIILGDGDSSVNQVDLGGLYFFSLGDVDITEQGDIFIIEERNQANRLTLTTPGSIADADNAGTTVNLLSTFNANNVTIGDSLNDRFNSGSIRFDVENQFFFRENSGTNLAGNSSSASANIGAAGNITNSDDTTVNVTGVTRLLGQNVLVGNETGDEFNFGSLVVTTDGDAFITEDSSTVFAGNSTADLLAINSAGSITNTGESTLNVQRVANFQAANAINIGNAVDDQFNAAAVTANSSANVLINEDSATILTGDNAGNAFNVTSTGSILNAANSTVDVATTLLLNAGGAINLGSQTDDITDVPNDRVEFSSVTFNSPGNVLIETQADAIITGSNSGGIVNLIAQDGDTFFDILDQTDAEIEVQGSLFLTGLDVVIGEGLMDSLTVGGAIINGNIGGGIFNVTEDA